jgi:DNA-directed RNA polymerase specialized sigma24 family protein
MERPVLVEEAGTDGSCTTGGLLQVTGRLVEAVTAESLPWDREVGDKVLFARLEADGFTGPVYDRVADRLARYGYQVLQAWVRSGDVFSVCARKKIKGLPAVASWSGWAEADIDDLVQETVAAAIMKFRRHAMAGRGWRPAGGASPTSYFAVTCLYAFSAVYRRHLTARRRHANTDRAAAQRHIQPGHTPDVAETVIEQATAEEILASIADQRLRFIIQLAAAGYSHREISCLLADGTTPRAVEALLYRYRRQIRGDADAR